MPVVKYSPEKKFEVVLEGIKNGVSIAELCRKHTVSEAIFYRWKELFFNGGKQALTGKWESPNMELKRKIAEYERVIGKITVQNEILKKTLED